MKYVTFVSGLKCEQVLHTGAEEYTYRTVVNPLASGDGVLGLSHPAHDTHRAVPITRLCEAGKADVYVAWSEEVEALLGIPMRALHEQIRRLTEAIEYLNFVKEKTALQHQTAIAAHVRTIRNMSECGFWSRLRFAINGRWPT